MSGSKRLFTFGCSFSRYDWPTWADLLGYNLNFNENYNWAAPGLGNRAIAERIAECHSKYKFTKEDTVLVQWSSHLRHDYHTFSQDEKDPAPSYGWKTKGSLFNLYNSERYGRRWFEVFFDEKSYVMHSLNAMIMAQGLLKSTGATWLMTTIADFKKLGNDFLRFSGDGEHVPGSKDLLQQYPEFDHYIETIWDNHEDNWLEPIGSFCWKDQTIGDGDHFDNIEKNYSDAIDFEMNANLQHLTDSPMIYKFANTNPKTKASQPHWWDPHPSTLGHSEYVTNIVNPKLGFKKELNDKQQYIVSKVDQNYNQLNDPDLFTFRHNVGVSVMLELGLAGDEVAKLPEGY